MSKSKFYETLYEDKSLIVVNKQAGIAVVPTRDQNEMSLVKILQKKYDQHIYVVHRIDRDTSGIVVFAFEEESHKHLSAQFFKRQTEKHYRCISNGRSTTEWTTIDKKLSLDKGSKKVVVDRSGKEAVSHYQSLDESKSYSFNAVKIDTGRTHQIRVHLASVGLPIVGDPLYNMSRKLKLSSIKKKYVPSGKGREERPLMPRCALHAFSLKFKHPVTGMEKYFEAEPPKDMRACWSQIKKWDV